MDIKSVSSAYGAMAYESAPKPGKKPETPKPAKASTEVVALSDESLNLKKVKDAVYQAPDIRIPIVEAIREKIRNNSYPIDVNAQSVLEILQKNRIL
jgi:anti-sigma28 factor (negative regulator of flagellin synthesis)